MIIKDETDDIFRRGNVVLVTSHPGTLVEDGLEEKIIAHQLCLASFADLGVDVAPPVGDDDNILEGGVSTESSEHSEVLRRYPTHSGIGDPVEV